MKHFAFLIPLLLPLLFSCGGPKPEKAAKSTAKPGQEPAKVPASAAKAPPKRDKAVLTEVDFFLRFYTQGYLGLQQKSAEADWALNTVIVEGDDSNSKAYEKAEGDLAQYTGSVEMIKKAKRYLESEAALTDLQVRQLKAVLYAAARSPQTEPELVKARIKADAAQTEALFGFDFKIDGKSVTTNEIDRILEEEDDEALRLAAWSSSKEVGKGLKKGLANLVSLRNRTVQALDYKDFFQYQVSDYGMTVPEMMGQMRRFARELRPLYRELHTWARYRLAKKFKKKVPDLLPAHWLPNRWGQGWGAMVKVEGFDLDGKLAGLKPVKLVQAAEDFYVSLGFDPLPESFYKRSSLFPLPPGSLHKKNNHASAWHMDLEKDVRCLMSVEPNARWWETTHHELGHIYYYIDYTSPEVPPLLREGANRGFHEAIGSLLGLASMQKAFLQGRGLVAADAKVDELQVLLKEALEFVVFIPFSTGTMTHFEHDLYATDLPISSYNERWWKYVEEFQGIRAPQKRGEEFCDAASKTHINNDAAQYYDYAISYILLHQFHSHIARKILGQDPRNTNYYGNKKAGEFLRGILKLGATRDWRVVLQETIGSDISARAMLDYFEPLLEYLRKENEGRRHTLGEV
ncbi:MAG: M2 family metallopeptidase [Planctomycetota bacterium]|nr:M2 family metallopeptidase [Planctomycetota bacterium]